MEISYSSCGNIHLVDVMKVMLFKLERSVKIRNFSCSFLYS